MLESIYVEDVFKEFYLKTIFSSVSIPFGDQQAIENFNELCNLSRPLTEKQSRYMLALLKKYHSQVCDAGFDYKDALAEPTFKHPFRIIDERRRAYVETTDDGIMLCLKFPFSFKDRFEQEFEKNNNTPIKSFWDSDKQARTVDIYSVNLMWIQSFLEENAFEFDDGFLEAVAATETAWDNQDDIIPYCCVDSDQVVLKNATADTAQWYASSRSGIKERDLLLAKSAGYLLRDSAASDLFAVISSSTSNNFWIKDLVKFFHIFNTLDTKCCIIMDRTEDRQAWLEKFVESAHESNISRSDVKVCFREKTAEDPFNVWVKEAGLGGKTEEGKIFIFEHRPAKWIFRKPKEVGMLATTSINPPTNLITRNWMDSHPLSFFLTNIRPTQKGHREIVEL